jgi:hypothetical protein
MKDKWDRFKKFAKKDPITTAFLASIAIGTALKAADQVAGIQSKRAYAKQVNNSLKNAK